ncbi:MAG: response regulator transcription factor [Chitinophagales bacterium]|nr:response regulator transcription factor [Chitinophagales bacterium]
MAPKINILIADTQILVREGLKCLLSKYKNIAVIAEVSNSKDLILSSKKLQPDVIMFDYWHPTAFDIDDITLVKNVSPKSQFVVISADNSKQNVLKVIEKGVLSYLTKECDEEEIIGSIRAVLKKEKYLCHKVIDIIIDKHTHQGEDICKAFNLSSRETEIIKLTAKGWDAKTIAEHLFLSTHTIYTHKKNIMKKLDINTTSEMIVYAIQNGLAEKEELA